MAKRLVLNGALKRTGNGSTATADAGVPRYAFIAHPACCPKCSMMDSKLTGRLYSVADTWRITHPNCCCATIEVPAGIGLGAAAVQAFAANPVGGILRRGFNYGKSFAPTKLTAGNVANTLAKYERNAIQTAKTGLRSNLARKAIVSQQKGAYRKAYNKGKENWNNVLVELPKETAKMEKVKLDNGKKVTAKKGESFENLMKRASTTKMKQKAPLVKAARNTDGQQMFTMSGGISSAADVKRKNKKTQAAKIVSRRAASKGTRDMAKLFGAAIK